MVFVQLPDISSGQELLFVALPVCSAAISASILLLHSVLTLKSVNALLVRVGIVDEQIENISPPGIGKGVILCFRVARLFGCLGLTAVSFLPFVHGHEGSRRETLTHEGLLSAPYLYASVLAFLSVSPKHTRHRLIRHANCVLFLTFCVYFYRDLFPLVTFTGIPADLSEGLRLWVKIVLLFITAVVIPLCTPRQYIPVDPLNPMAVPNPEQTASIFSFAFYFFLDRIVFLAYRESQLPEDDLYPLCDTDASAYLTARSFKYLDRFSGRKGDDVRPWVWIAMLFLGPVVGTAVISTRSLVRTEAIITQLVFAHRQVGGLSSWVETNHSQFADPDEGNGKSSSLSEDNSMTLQARTLSTKSVEGEQPPKHAKEKGKKLQASLIGKINNLVTVDLKAIVDSREFLVLVVFIPLQLIMGIFYLYVLLGWSVWVGVASIILLAPVPGYMATLVQSVQRERLKRTDDRIQSVSEAVNVLRMVKTKMFGWEEKMKARIRDKRDSELIWIRKRRAITLANYLVKCVYRLPKTLVMRQPLNASKVFSSMTVFDLLSSKITMRLTDTMTGKVSLDRVNEFLKQTELLDGFDEKPALILFTANATPDERIGFRNATFSWSKESDGSLTRSQRQFLLKIDGEVLFERGRINLVIGPTASDSWFNLPSGSGVAYAAQESWVLNETIRSNIIFDTPFDEERYKKVLYQCALEPDLALFQAGDQTEIGEKGLTLSGGQKARITLARAVYSKASLLLLDDVLAALEKTHNVALVRPIADFVITLGSDGRVRSQGTMAEITKSGSSIVQIHDDQQVLNTRQEHSTGGAIAKPADGKLVVAEEIQIGHVGSSALKMYLFAMGGKYPLVFFAFFFGGLVFSETAIILKTWMLGYWAKQYDQHPVDEVDVVFFLSVFVAIVFISTATLSAVFFYIVFGQLRASKVIHENLINSVLSAPLRWLDTTPTSRILARVTNDVKAVDDSLGVQFYALSSVIISMMVKICAVLIYAPICFFPGAFVGAMGAWVGQIYIASQLPVKRLMSNTRAPVLAHFGAAITGLGTKLPSSLGDLSIRAFGAQSKFTTESLARIDRYTRAARNFYNLNRWVSIRVDILGALFSAGLATYLVYIKPSSAGDTGFLINMAIAFTRYIDIEHEKPATDGGKPPAYWPASGDLRVEHLSARYSKDGPQVLHNISFHIKSGERVGIVGRTGSGKSSLTLSLLRCLPTEGSVIYDGLETSALNLDALRSSITIIPQVPELLSGSLRSNLDPFGQYDDVELNDALRAAGLFALQDETDEGQITLDSAISVGGSNLSVGQRQIFALARAIVRKSKILILDEDYNTDTIIQNSLRQELRGDVSCIIVAHRLQTIMDADKIVEFDSPKELLKIKDGKLRALVEESSDREDLYAMAGVA
ncbi:hypothetical protein B0H13DRAFT_2242056 [Mycena leptocephala]|nr:hypothetical protein B0H13DRAFT_2242056 [Mycena leptocephala]